jgi:hypothetical protein
MDLAPSISGDWKVESVDAVIDSKGKDNVSISWEEDTYKGHRRFTGTLTGGTLYGRFETEGSSSWEPDEISWTADGVGYGVFSADGAKLSFLKLTKDEAVYLDFQIQSKTL